MNFTLFCSKFVEYKQSASKKVAHIRISDNSKYDKTQGIETTHFITVFDKHLMDTIESSLVKNKETRWELHGKMKKQKVETKDGYTYWTYQLILMIMSPARRNPLPIKKFDETPKNTEEL